MSKRLLGQVKQNREIQEGCHIRRPFYVGKASLIYNFVKGLAGFLILLRCFYPLGLLKREEGAG
jgi:hypothetical protein